MIEIVPQFFAAAKILHLHGADLFGDLHLAVSNQPVRKVIELAVKDQRFIGDIADLIFKFGDIGSFIDDIAVLVSKAEIAKAQIIDHIAAQIGKEVLGIFVQKVHSQIQRIGLIFSIGRL